MKSQELNQYRKQLEEQLASLRETVDSHERQLEESHNTNDFIGGDRAAELENLEVDSSIVDSEENLARKIEHALERIDEGVYGICEGCGGEIPVARLQAKPSVSLCIDCQEKHEAASG